MKAQDSTILKFIKGDDKVFVIPPFQRNYEWTSEQCEELFNDIVDAYKENKNHYLGNIVYYEGSNSVNGFEEYILVDGQQRITSILLLLCAIRDISADILIKRSIDKHYLKNEEMVDTFRVKLKQTSYDAESFTAIVEKIVPNDDSNNIVKNYKYFIQLLEGCDVSPEDIYNTIPKLEVVGVNLKIHDDLSAVQTIFEKINSTGKQLEPSDLIRNYLLISNSVKEQENLYNNYWVKIEQTITNEYISKFAKDYLIMKKFDDVPKDLTFKMFKDYCKENEIEHENILSELRELSKYYKWLLYENSPNEKLNHIISYLNLLKTEDLYPLYLYLLRGLYDKNTSELCKILDLLSDFMIRYRIVAPSGGGGALRTVIQQIIEKLSNSCINPTYEGILFELSNSPTAAGRFPTDIDFYNALKTSNKRNHTYARCVLLKIEEYETKNIQVALKNITIEHLMPQTLSEWWISNLGGKEKSDKIYDEYIDCIGNLTPMSQGYNSQNSNKPWTTKLKHIKEVQFKVTSEIADTKQWRLKEIEYRNEDIAKRACDAITSPLERSIPYQTKQSSGEFEDGIYYLSDLDISVRGTRVTSVLYDDKIKPVKAWRDFLKTMCEIAYDIDSDILDNIIRNNEIHKKSKSKNQKDYDPMITYNKSLLTVPILVPNTKIYVEGNISADYAKIYAKKLMDIYGLADNFQIEVESKD